MAVGHAEATELLGSLSSLIRTSRAVTQRSSAEMGASGTPLGVLKTLTTGDLRPSDLATALHVAPSVISRAIVPLEDAGLVDRATDPCDGRATLLTLTALGRQRLAELQDAYVERVSAVLDGWSDDEVHEAAAVVRRLESALTDAIDPEAHRLLTTSLIPTELPPDSSTDTPSDADVEESDVTRTTRKPVPA